MNEKGFSKIWGASKRSSGRYSVFIEQHSSKREWTNIFSGKIHEWMSNRRIILGFQGGIHAEGEDIC